MSFDTRLEEPVADESEIEVDRGETGIRILFTLLFFVIARVVEGMLLILVLFELGITLVTQREPSAAIRRFANHTLSYLVHIGRYITYNDDDAPFPFDEFPGELDLSVPATPSRD